MTLNPTSSNTPTLADGIHIDLPFDQYLADTALQSSDIKNLLISPLQYWINSHLNPNRPPRKESAAKDLGTLVHEVVLEGAQKKFAVKPEGISFANKAGKEWRSEKLETGHTILTSDENRTLTTIVEACRRSGVTEVLEGAIPEVTYIWTHESGHRMKIRLDALKPTMAFDLKTFANQMDKDLETCVAFATGNLRYHISAYWYRMGIDHMRDLIKRDECQIHTHGENHQAFYDMAEDLAGYDGNFPHWYIFVEKDGIPNVIPRHFTKRNGEGLPANEYWKSAQLGTDYATRIFAEHSAEFAPGEMWMRPTEWKPFSDDELGAARSIFQ
tara:strand:+ start:53 stop:1036 length:984 start_codon:yes stop_codon:yes gene_type:complete